MPLGRTREMKEKKRKVKLNSKLAGKWKEKWYLRISILYPMFSTSPSKPGQSQFICTLIVYPKYSTASAIYNLPSSSPSNIYTCLPSLNNLIELLRNIKATKTKNQQSSSNSPKPLQITFMLLTWHPDVHTP